MSTQPIVACDNCGRRNRLPVIAEGFPRCAVCHHPLAWIVEAGDDRDRVAAAQLRLDLGRGVVDARSLEFSSRCSGSLR
jgi:hypothetical protein